MTRITFIQPHLRFGGAERQTVLVANRLAAQGYEVHVVLHRSGEGLFSELSFQVIVHDLGIESHLATLLIAFRMRRALKRIGPSFVVVKLWSSILACALIDRLPGAKHHVYNYCEDLDPTDHAKYIRFGKFKQFIISRIFRNREHLSANTNTVAESMMTVYQLVNCPAIIPSTVDIDLTNRLARSDNVDFGAGLNVVSVGSLIRRKGLDVTLQALLLIDRPITWHIVGDGPLRDEYDSFRDGRGMLRIAIYGGLSNPYPIMQGADLLVHSARSEAWGIVLLESMALGTAVLAADAIGPREMRESLGDRPNIMQTYPVGDVEALAARLDSMLTESSPSRREMQDYVRPFSLDHASAMWLERAEELLAE